MLFPLQIGRRPVRCGPADDRFGVLSGQNAIKTPLISAKKYENVYKKEENADFDAGGLPGADKPASGRSVSKKYLLKTPIF